MRLATVARLLAAALAGVTPAAAPQSGAAPIDDRRLEQRFDRVDRNGDGKVTARELRRPALFRRLDRNGDGAVTRDELPQRTRSATTDRGAPRSARSELNLAYGTHDARRLDLYAPRAAHDAPVMAYVHGGGWRRGDKAHVGEKAACFTARRWVFVSINYRLLPEGAHPANVQDVAAALAWVHDHVAEYGGDPRAIFLMGHSAGAHLAALVATDARYLSAVNKEPSIIKGVIALDTNTYDLPALMRSGAAQFYGQVFGEDPEVWRDAAPATHVSPGKRIPPFLICYSRGMREVPNPAGAEQAHAFAEALRAAGVQADVVDASDRSHAEINARFGQSDDDVTRQALAFLEALQKPSAMPAPAEPPPPTAEPGPENGLAVPDRSPENGP